MIMVIPLTEKKRRNACPCRRIAGMLLSFLLVIRILVPLILVPVRAEQRIIRAGYFANGDFMNKNEDGLYSGYDIAYYYTLAGYAGWKVEFTEYANLNAALDGLEKGEIDILSGLSLTPERDSRFIRSESKMCTTRISIQTRADDIRYVPGQISSMENMTCGILRGSNVVALYEDWCSRNRLTPHLIEYDSLTERNAAFEAGNVDAVAAGSTMNSAQKVAEFPPLDLYFMLNKDQRELKEQLDTAMQTMSLQNPTYEETIYLEYFPVSRNTELIFYEPEKEYLTAHPQIQVGVLADDAPFSYQGKDSSMMGYLPEYFAHLSEQIGVAFACRPYASQDDLLKALKDGTIDIIGKGEVNIYDANQRDVLQTNPFLSMNLVQVTGSGHEDTNIIGVPSCIGSKVGNVLKAGNLPNQVQIYNNSSDCFRALRTGEIDAVVCAQQAATWMLTRNRSSEYIISAFGNDPWEACFSLRPDTDGSMLRGILNKTIAVDHGYIDQMIATDALNDSADVSNLLNRLPIGTVIMTAFIALFLLLIVVIALVSILRNRKEQQKLARQQAMLAAEEEAAKARNRFFSSVSHDMRTPLNGILGFTDLALANHDPAVIHTYLTKIRASGDILNNLIDDTLTISHMENDRMTLNAADLNLKDLLGGISQSARLMAGEKDIRYTDHVAGMNDDYVKADGMALQKVLLNLLSNAIKFTPAGGEVIFDCSISDDPQEKREHIFTVRDTGIGISKEFGSHLYEPFTREDPVNSNSSGNGLGLAIVKRIVDNMGGTISCQSEKGHGTVFTVRLHLPACTEKESAASAERHTELLKGRRVLVCEDNDLNLEIEKTILEQNGIEVTVAGDGRQGLSLFEQSREYYFDCILLDLRMPVMDGYETARAIRQLKRADAASVPVFAISADANQENIEEAEKAGMNGHIAKPINVDQLIRVLIDATAEREAGRQQA